FSGVRMGLRANGVKRPVDVSRGAAEDAELIAFHFDHGGHGGTRRRSRAVLRVPPCPPWFKSKRQFSASSAPPRDAPVHVDPAHLRSSCPWNPDTLKNRRHDHA